MRRKLRPSILIWSLWHTSSSKEELQKNFMPDFVKCPKSSTRKTLRTSDYYDGRTQTGVKSTKKYYHYEMSLCWNISWLKQIFLISFLPTLAYLTNALHILSLVFMNFLCFLLLARPTVMPLPKTWQHEAHIKMNQNLFTNKTTCFPCFLDQPNGAPIEDQKCAVLSTFHEKFSGKMQLEKIHRSTFQ